MKRIPLLFSSPQVQSRDSVFLTQGIPFRDGDFSRGDPCRVVDSDGNTYPTQASPLATWAPDLQYVKWLLIDAELPTHLTHGAQQLYIEYGPGAESRLPPDPLQFEFHDELRTQLKRIENGSIALEFFELAHADSGEFLRSLKVCSANGWRDLTAGRSAPVLYLTDDRGRSYDSVTGAPPPVIKVEERGPIRGSVIIQGVHAGDSGETVCPYTLRIHVYGGSKQLRIFHTFTFDQNPDRFKLAEIGLKFPWNLGELSQMMVAGNNGGFHVIRDRQASWLQVDDQKYRVTANGTVTHHGEKTSGWAALDGAEVFAAAVIRDCWQEYPKGIRLHRDGLMDIQLWPRDSQRILDLEVPWKEEFIHCSRVARTEEQLLRAMAERPTAGVNFKGFYGSAAMPAGAAEGNMQSVRDALDFAARHLQNRRFVIGDVSALGRATGVAKTHELWLDFGAAPCDPSAVAEWATTVQTPLLAPPDPPYTSRTNVLRIVHPRNGERYAELEESLDTLFDNVVDGPVRNDRLYGMLDYGDLLNAHGRAHGYTYRVFKELRDKKITDAIGWFNNECFDNCFTQWVNYLRTADRKYWRLAEAYSEHLEDVDTIHCDPIHPENVGLTHYHNILHWSAAPSRSHTQIQGWLLHYYLTGNRHALDVAREAADNFIANQEPSGMVSNRRVALRREFTGPMGTVWFFHQATWEKKYLDCALRSLDGFLQTQKDDGSFPRDIFTAGELGENVTVSEKLTCPRGWYQEPNVLYDIYQAQGDERIRKSVIRMADDIIERFRAFAPTTMADYIGDTFLISEKITPMWLAFAYELTKDPKYLEPLQEFLEHLPDIARSWAQFDKWIPFMSAGYMSLHAAIAMDAVEGGQ